MSGSPCPACGSAGVEVFHEQIGVPVNSCLLVDDLRTALEFPRGDLRLGWCPSCGFVTNTAFDVGLSQYSERYEETQGFSPTFRAFASDLASRWIDRYDIHGKDVVEVGCGKGEFLQLMVELGDNRGIGIDPAYVPGRMADDPRLTFIRDFWSEAYAGIHGDVVVCRHTLEHIAPVGSFVEQLRASIGERLDTIVLFELPDARRVLAEAAFWDIYYEHCSYFTAGSLARLFRRKGFEILGVELDYDDQYLLLEARPARSEQPAGSHALEDDLERVSEAVAAFPDTHAHRVAELRRSVDRAGRRDGPAVLWGAGSKAVSFLSTLGRSGQGEQIAAAVDINPFKQGRYLAGSGHRVLAPDDLLDDPPGTVFVMNSIYTDEVRNMLRARGLEPHLVAL